MMDNYPYRRPARGIRGLRLVGFLAFLGIIFLLSAEFRPISGQLTSQKTATPSNQKGAVISRPFNIPTKGKEVIDFDVLSPGLIEARAEWTGTADTLALILNGPGLTQAYSRKDGRSPLSLSFNINQALLAKGNACKLSVANFGNGSAQGRVEIKLPAAPAGTAPGTSTSAKTPSAGQKTTPQAKTGTGLKTSGQAQTGLQAQGSRQTAAAQGAQTKPSAQGRVNWSVIGQRQRSSSEQNRPPVVGEKIDVVVPAKPFQFNANIVRVNRRSPLPFKAFEVVDPSTGNAVNPDTVFTLPNGVKVNAAEYYAELNRQEQEFNSLGYSLDLRRDPSETVKLMQIVLPKNVALEANQRKQTFIAAHKMQGYTEPLNFNELRSQYQQRMKQDKARLQQLQQYRRQQRPNYSPSGQQDTGQPREYDNTQTWDGELGSRESFAIYLSTKAGITAKKPVVSSSLSGGNASLAIKGADVSAGAEAEAGAYVIDNKIQVLRLSAMGVAPTPGKKAMAKVTAWVVGFTYDIINWESPAIPDNIGYDLIPESCKYFKSETWEKSLDVSYGSTFPVGPILLSVKVGAKASAGFQFLMGLSPLSATASFGPFVRVDAYAQAGISIIIAEAGVRCTLTLLDCSLRLQADIALNVDSKGPYFALNLSIYDQIEALSGNVEFYVCCYVPAWRLPPWKKKCWDWELVSWDGITSKGYLYQNNIPFYLFGEGETDTTDKTAEDQKNQQTGEAGTWVPAEGSRKLRDYYNISYPSAADFNGQLHIFWLDRSASINHYYSSLEGLTGSGPQIYPASTRIPQLIGNGYLTLATCVFQNRLYVFRGGTTQNPAVYYKYVDTDNAWWPPTDESPVTGSKVTRSLGVTVHNNVLYLFFTKPEDNKIYYTTSNHDWTSPGDPVQLLAWTPAKAIPGTCKTKGAIAGCSFNGLLYIFFKGADNNNIYYRHMDQFGNWLAQDYKVDGAKTSGGPSVAIFNNELYLVYTSSNTNKPRIYFKTTTASALLTNSFTGERDLNKASETYESPYACVFKDFLFVFHMSTNANDLRYRWYKVRF
jgi:hypothetical protein